MQLQTVAAMSGRSTVVAELAYWSGEAERLSGKVADLRHRIRVAKRALRKSTKYEPWDDFEWIASIALDLRRSDYALRKPVKGRR